MPKEPVTLLLLSAQTPLCVGLYDASGVLVRRYERTGQISQVLYPLFREIGAEFEVVALAYARGPGSFMGLKLGFVFLRSFAIAKKIPMRSASSFFFSAGAPIVATRHSAYLLSDDKISLCRLESAPENRMQLPKRVDFEALDEPLEPLYIQPAV